MLSEIPVSRCVLICTHKRGAAVALIKQSPEGSLASNLSNAADGFCRLSESEPERHELPLTHAAVSVHRTPENDLFFAICAGLTAENLAELYRHALFSCGAEDAEVFAVGVVTGPGSFTGLRLGCAFANGLMLGRPRELWGIDALPPSQVRQSCSLLVPARVEAFFGADSPDEDDPFAAPVSFADLLAHLVQWRDGAVRVLKVAEPVYGRDPTPVIKLRLKQGENQS